MMSNVLPAPNVIEGILARFRVVYSTTMLTIHYEVKILPYLATIVAAIAFLFLCLPYSFGNVRALVFVLSVPLILCSLVMGERSYRYEFDKEKQEIRCSWVGFQGIYIVKRKTIHYPLSDLQYIRIQQIQGRGGVKLKIKAVLQNFKELELPYGYLLGECMKAANDYRDFLEISAPIQLPE